jgi:hypothetical protein
MTRYLSAAAWTAATALLTAALIASGLELYGQPFYALVRWYLLSVVWWVVTAYTIGSWRGIRAERTEAGR